jgi:hypothetical protein
MSHLRRLAKRTSATSLQTVFESEDEAATVLSYADLQEICFLRAACRNFRNRPWASGVHQYFYVFGGCTSPTHVERVDFKNGSWQSQPQMPPNTAPVGASGTAVAGQLFVCGGIRYKGTVNTVNSYSPETGVWKTLPPMQNRRAWHVCAAVRGSLIVCGGKNENTALASVESFNILCGEWEAMQQMRHMYVYDAF